MASLSTDIVRADLWHRSYVLSLARKFDYVLGSLPPAAYDYHLERGNILMANENGEPCGFLCPWPAMKLDPRLSTIVAAAIQLDAQRRHHGLALVATLEAQVKAAGRSILQCRVRDGEACNEFWRIAGFTVVARVEGGRKRKRMLNVWRKALVPMPAEELTRIIIDPRKPQRAGGYFTSPAETSPQLVLPFPADTSLSRPAVLDGR